VNASAESCPAITLLGIAPAELDVGAGGAATVSATATLPGGQAAPVWWSATGGHLDDPSAASTTFECTAGGIVTVTATATNAGCSDHASGTVACLDLDASNE
jgi:hypothetical protein